MSFLTILALAIGALVAAPYLAHRLRRQRAEERPFAPARLVPPSPPKARRRARLEDKSLFAIRALSVVALALLGASPLAKCSRLSLSRGGASVAVAIVIDDSMSMRVVDGSGKTRFARAKQGALEVLASLRDGDAAAIVLAGGPARVGLAATTDVSSAKHALEGLGETDRATDLDGAIAIAKTLVGELPQIDRRIIVLSDLADGKGEAAAPVGEGAGIPVWIAMPELAKEAAEDCGILGADRTSNTVRVRVACSTTKAAAGRDVVMKEGERNVASVKLPETQLGEVTFGVEGDVKEPAAGSGAEPRGIVELSGRDAIASDDRAPVVVESGPAALAVVGDRPDTQIATGGAPVVEQALAALHVEMSVRPLPEAPDRREDTTPFAALVFDDPPGFTPEQRRALADFVERGGVMLLALGRRAAVAPLGASFEPFLGQAVSWSSETVQGVDAKASATIFGEATASFVDLAPKGRAKLGDADAQAYERLLDWSDGAPFVLRRTRGRGEIWVTTLPFSVDASDFALRPGFLSLLDAFVTEAKQRAAPRRSDVGSPWAFVGAQKVNVEGPKGPVAAVVEANVARVVPELIGTYAVSAFGTKELRVAAPVAREIDLRPRRASNGAVAANLGGGVAIVDVSWIVALVLLGLVALEIVLRAVSSFSAEPGSRKTESST